MAEKWTEKQLTQLLRIKHSNPSQAFASQVPNATGMAQSRTCDGLAMGLWPSKGLHLTGYEIKVSRSDWLNELQDLSKSRAFQQYCHYWYIVAPKGIVQLEEMPAEWGLLCPTSGEKLRTKKGATLRDPLTPSFELLAGIFRALVKNSASAAEIEEANRSGYTQGLRYAEQNAIARQPTEVRRLERELDYLKKNIEAFEQATGLKLNQWRGEKLGKLVNAVAHVPSRQLLRTTQDQLERLQDAEAHLEQCRQQLEELAELDPVKD